MNNCVGCGLNGLPMCKCYRPQKKAEIQKRLHERVVTFTSKPKPQYTSVGRSAFPEGVCELATLMEMLCIPHLDSEEIPMGLDIFSHTLEAKNKVDAYVRTLTAKSIRASQRPTFDPPTATFPEVENLTLDLSLEVDDEIKQRLFEFFEEKGESVVDDDGGNINIRYKTLKKEYSDTCRFDLKTRFPNLKLLTVAEHTEHSEGALLPFFLLPASVRVLRTNTNVLEHGDRFTDFLSNIPRLSDLLIDPTIFNTRSAIDEPGTKHRDGGVSAHTRVQEIADIDMSKLPGVRRFRLTDTTVVDSDNRPLKICEFIEGARAPSTLRSLEFPFTSAEFRMNMMFGSFQGLAYPLLKKNISSLLDIFRCEFPENIKRVDISCPSIINSNAAPDKRRKENYIIILVDAFEQCYFEDMLHKIDSFFSKHSHREKVDEKITRNLKRNLRLFLGGSQFGLPASFADNVIHQIEERFDEARHELSKASFFSQKALSVKSDKPHSKNVSYLNSAKIQRDKLQGMMGEFLEKSLKSKLYAAHHLMSDISKKTHGNIVKAYPDQSITDNCECEICKIVVTAGLKDNSESKLPFSISAIESMAEYDEIFFPKDRNKSPSRSPSRSHTHRRRRSRAPSPPESRNAINIGGRKRIGSRKYIRRIRANKTHKI